MEFATIRKKNFCLVVCLVFVAHSFTRAQKGLQNLVDLRRIWILNLPKTLNRKVKSSQISLNSRIPSQLNKIIIVLF